MNRPIKERKRKIKKMIKCDECGKEKDDVKECFDPYSDEINDEKIKCNLCDECYHDRCMEI